MKSLLVGLFLLSLSLTAHAQAVNDSLYMYKQNMEELQFSKNAVSQLLVLPVVKSSRVGLNFSGQSGGYRRAQVAQNSQIAEFSAEGVSTLNKFKVSGYFTYSRTSDDSLAWNQQGIPNEDRPYYFASAKAGPYQRDQFYMGGQLGYELVRNRWYIGSGIDYLYNTATRSVDPRPSVKTFRLVLKPELSYKFSGNTLGVGVTWGSGYEENGISYTSDAYRENTSEIYKPWITYLSAGYGSAYPQRSAIVINRDQKFKGINLSAKSSIGVWSFKGILSYLLSEEYNRSTLVTSLGFDNIANYQVEQLNAAFLISHKSSKLSHQIKINLDHEDGTGYYNRIGGKNYYLTRKAYHAAYNIMLSRFERTTPGFNAGATYQNIKRRDLSVYSSNDYAWLQPYVGMALYDHINKSNAVSATLEFFTLLPVKNQITAPVATVTEFTKGVVFPDYYYYKSIGGGFKANVKYISSSLLQGFRSGIDLQVGYNHKLSSPSVDLPANFIASNTRLTYGLAFNLYF